MRDVEDEEEEEEEAVEGELGGFLQSVEYSQLIQYRGGRG